MDALHCMSAILKQQEYEVIYRDSYRLHLWASMVLTPRAFVAVIALLVKTHLNKCAQNTVNEERTVKRRGGPRSLLLQLTQFSCSCVQ